MSFVEYEQHDALGLAALVRRGDLHPRELVEAAIERIERHNPALNAVTIELYDRARAAAERPLSPGPLPGVPYLLKDMVLHAGTPVTLGTAFLRRMRYVAAESHPVVRRSERAGLIVLGKTNACELGLLPTTEPLAYGPTTNPWRPGRSPGGSSGGSAAAVAAGLVPMAHGNDGGGSIRIPAAACGVFGLKPSRGRNPGSPADLPVGLTVEHCLSRSVRDSAALLDVTCGALPGDRYQLAGPARPFLEEVEADPGRLRIAFGTRDLAGRAAHPDCAEAVQGAAALCAELGHEVEEVAPSVDGERFYEAFLATWALLPGYAFKLICRGARAESAALDLAARLLGEERVVDAVAPLAGGLIERPFEPLTRELMALSARLTPADQWLAAADLQQASHELGRFLERYDLWLTPVLAEPPLGSGEIHGGLRARKLRDPVMVYAAYTPICNASGLPAMSVPLHWNAQGLPVGVQFIGRLGGEATLFRLAGQLERARPWRRRRPDLAP